MLWVQDNSRTSGARFGSSRYVSRTAASSRGCSRRNRSSRVGAIEWSRQGPPRCPCPAIGNDPHADVFTDSRAQIGQRGIGHDKCPVVVSGEGFHWRAPACAAGRRRTVRFGAEIGVIRFIRMELTPISSEGARHIHLKIGMLVVTAVAITRFVSVAAKRADRMVGSTRKADEGNNDLRRDHSQMDCSLRRPLFLSKAIAPLEKCLVE